MRLGCVALAGFPVAFSMPVHAQTASRVALADAPGKPYDLVANCLMRQLSGGQYKAWPLVYAPPRREALVNVWLRGRDYDPPIAVFYVLQSEDGITRVSYERTPGARAPDKPAAEAAAQRCLR